MSSLAADTDAPDLLLPDGLTIEAGADAIASRLVVRDVGTERVLQRYYDTFDGLVRAAGGSLVHGDGRLALLDRATGRERAAARLESAPARAFAGELPAGALRDELRRVADVRALLQLATVETRTMTLAVLDDAEKMVARIVLEQPSLQVPESGRLIALRGRARTQAVRGYGKERSRARVALTEGLGFEVAGEPLVDEAVRAAGARPEGVSAKIEVELKRGQRADAAAVAVLTRLNEVIAANLPGTIADVDSEFLHDFRVALRRSRSVLRELAGAFPQEPLRLWRVELKWLQQVTGPARDMDVYVLDFEDFRATVPEAFRADLDPLLSVLRSRRLGARREMVRELRSERAARLFAGWHSFVSALEGLPEDDRPDAARPIGSVAAERISKVYRRMVRMGDAIGSSSPAEDYHELRKKGKELRYLLELFGAPLFDRKVVGPMIKTLKALQDTLGRHQDREVQVATLRGLTGEVAALPGGAQALLAMGLLVDRLAIDAAAARDEFAERFAAFASKSQRKLVRETFGR
jgi:CHAD domain-containing protein